MRKWQSTQNKNNRNKRNYSIGGLHTSPTSAVISLIFIAVLATIVSSNNTHATASTLSLSIDNSTVSVDIASVSTQGNFKKSSNSTISASTNNATGYTLSIAANSNPNHDKLINNNDNTAMLSSVTEATTEAAFSSLSGTAYNNMWGYLPSKHCTNATDTTTCTTNTDFLPAPTSSGDILDVTSAPNSTANEYQLAIGARVDSTTKIGAYTNTFNVILVGNAIPYTMTFIDSTVSDMPIDINTTSMTEQVTLPSNTPTRNGYTFLGWCTVQPTINPDGNDTCSGTTYQPSSTAYLDQQSTSNDFTFYAMWGGNYTIEGVTYMQDFNTMDSDKKAKIISSMPVGQQYQLIDNRDNIKYWIAKQADGKIWMTQNLDLCVGCTGVAALTSNNTDLNSYGSGIYSTNYSMANGTITWATPSTAITSSIVVSGTTVPSWTNSDTHPYSAEAGNIYYYTSGTAADDIISNVCDNKGNSENWCKHYHVGNYYNWAESVASSDLSNLTAQYSVAENSICPAGWRLPRGLSRPTSTAYSREIGQLLYASGVTSSIDTTSYANDGFVNIRKHPLFLIRSGRIFGEILNYAAQDGTIHASTVSSGNYIHDLHFTSSFVLSAVSEGSRAVGESLRCILR